MIPSPSLAQPRSWYSSPKAAYFAATTVAAPWILACMLAPSVTKS
jgi:hypothetical protein